MPLIRSRRRCCPTAKPSQGKRTRLRITGVMVNLPRIELGNRCSRAGAPVAFHTQLQSFLTWNSELNFEYQAWSNSPKGRMPISRALGRRSMIGLTRPKTSDKQSRSKVSIRGSHLRSVIPAKTYPNGTPVRPGWIKSISGKFDSFIYR